jgi:hypothetical protein
MIILDVAFPSYLRPHKIYMQVTEVKSERDKKDFLLLPLRIYKGDVNWIRPLDKDIEAVFNPKQNKFFRHGQCTRFLLKDTDEKVIARIAVFINEKTSKRESQPTGGIGFFECINNKEAAHMLFNHCKKWLQQKGMEAMDGPVNFGERDSWWGLTTEGFSPPPYKMNYNPPYYKELFESYGFKTYFEQWCYSLNPQERPQEKFYRRHAEIADDSDYRAEFIRKNNIEKYAEDFRAVYNKAWVKHGSGKELDSKQVRLFFRKMKPVIDEKIIWYVYHKNEPVAVWVNLPDINQVFKRFNGKFGWLQKLQFVFMLKRRVIRKFIGLVFGVVPEHQGKGVDCFMIIEGANLIQKEKLYEQYEMQWIGDFNPKMVSVAENLGTHKTRVLKTYRYLFDPTKEFKRHPIL